jgi:aminoglycoside 2'-N-acetyltransferase I
VLSTGTLVRALIAGLCVAAAVAIVALLQGDFNDTEWRIVGTSLGFSLFTAFGGAGDALRRQAQDWRALAGTATIAAAAIAFALLLAACWIDDEPDALWRAWGTAAFLALWGSLASLILRGRRETDSSLVTSLVVLSLVTSAFDTTVAVLAVTGAVDDPGDALLRLLGIVLVLTLLSSVLPPIIRRLGTAAPAPQRVRTAHTADLDAATLAAARALLEDVFDGELTAEDWEHCLGGIHALAYEGGELVGHAAVVQRRLRYDGRALRTGYVEGVGVHAAHRRRGHADALMAALERVIRGGYDVGALGASDEALPLYAKRGWRAWEGPLSAITPDGLVSTPEEAGAILVLTDELDLTRPLACDWREGELW